MRLIKEFFIALTLTLAAVGQAAQLTVQSPTENGYLGASNTMKVRITGATFESTVNVVITGPNDSVSTANGKFTPDTNGITSGSIPINFSDTAPSGAYTVVVSATSPGVTFTPVVVDVTVLPLPPKFLESNPLTNSFVKGVVHISALTSDVNIANWTVLVNGADIPNNSGTGQNVSVDWDTSTEKNQTAVTAQITFTDLAGNQSSQSISLTVDRTPPNATITYPQSSTSIIAGSQVNVIVDITKPSVNEMDATGIDVLAQTTTGAYITRVAMVSVKPLNATTLRWTGRIRTASVHLPKKFQIKVTAIDLAGNAATPQTATVTLR